MELPTNVISLLISDGIQRQGKAYVTSAIQDISLLFFKTNKKNLTKPAPTLINSHSN